VPVGVARGQFVGQRLCPLPTRSGGADVAVGEPVARPHMPAERVARVSGGFQVPGDDGRDVICGPLAVLERGSKTAVRLWACGFQL